MEDHQSKLWKIICLFEYRNRGSSKYQKYNRITRRLKILLWKSQKNAQHDWDAGGQQTFFRPKKVECFMFRKKHGNIHRKQMNRLWERMALDIILRLSLLDVFESWVSSTFWLLMLKTAFHNSSSISWKIYVSFAKKRP